MTTVRNPRAEATALLPNGYEARVLEPSPPADTDPAWFADDPTDPGGAGARVVTPIPGEGTTWADMAADNGAVADFAAEHWLDRRRELAPLPAGYGTSRAALHQVAYFAVAPARFAATGKLGLRYTHRGFGTPFFGADEQIRVEGDALVHQTGSSVRTATISTLEAAADFLGIPYREVWFESFHDPLAPLGGDVELALDPVVTEAIGSWFGFASHVLERARRTPDAQDVTRVQLWPEHFDPAFEMGSAEAGGRASYGASPGDAAHPEPYLYVAAWGEIDRSDPFWNGSFNGAMVSYQDLLGADDPYATALTFYEEGHRRLGS
jgi:hypothetical protein